MKHLVTSLVAVLLLAAGGCGSSSPHTSRAAPGNSAGNSASALPTVSPGLASAIRFLGSAGQSYTFDFADWAAIERTLGFSSLATPNAVAGLNKRLVKLGPIPAGLSSATDLLPSGPKRPWGAADVAWDASQYPSGRPPVSVVGFRPGFDMSGAERFLGRCGFAAQHLDGYVLYMATSSVALSCDGPLGDVLPGAPDDTYGFSPEERLVVMAASADPVRRAIAMRSSQLESSAAVSLIRRLGDPQALELDVGPAICRQLASPAVLAGRDASPASVARAARAYPPDHPYAGLGFDIQLSSSSPSGKIVFHYDNSEDAAADLATRASVLRSGSSIQAGVPFSNLVTLASATTSGNDIVLGLAPGTNGQLDAEALFGRFDIGFARCG